jgi:hypothetical protein
MANSGIHVFQSLAISPTEDSKCGLIFLHFYLVRFIVKTHVTLSPWSFLLLREEIFADWLCISKGEKLQFLQCKQECEFKISTLFHPRVLCLQYKRRKDLASLSVFLCGLLLRL